MIESTDEFLRLLADGDSPDLDRLAGEEVSESVCRDVLDRHPDRRAALI